MSETGQKKTTRKPRATKSTTGVDEKPVEQSAETQPTQAEQDVVKDEANINPVEPGSENPEQAESDKPEQDAEMAGSQQDEKDDSNDQLDPTETADAVPGGVPDAVGILGGFRVRAKSDAGFWRSGVQFLRLQEKLVLVVDKEPHASARVHAKDHEPEFVVFLTAEKAKRVHSEPNLIVEEVELSDVLDMDDMK